MKKEFTLLMMFIAFFLCVNNLKAISNITINNNQLIPSFDKSIHVYNVFVDESVQIITINVSEEDGEIITGSGSKSLKIGLNNIEIVSYINGEINSSYILNITRGEVVYDKENASLKTLEIVGYNIDFKSDKYNYEIEAKENDESLIINYKPVNPLSKVKVYGDLFLNKEDNKIIIEVISEDKKHSSSYEIKVKKDLNILVKDPKENIFKNHKFTSIELKIIRITIITIVLISITLLIYFIFIKKRTNKVLYIKRSILRK